MVDAGHARCVRGNHEFNAIGFATRRRDGSGTFLRPHSARNMAQHAGFLRQVGAGSARHRGWVRWFRTLPPMRDLGGIRAVHACWHEPHVATVAAGMDGDGGLADDFLHEAFDRATPAWAAMGGLTKGLEVRLPAGHSFFDPGGVERREMRTKWWHEAPRSFRDVAIVGLREVQRVPDHPLPQGYVGAPVRDSPVFVGHDWMEGEPVRMAPQLACLDWSAARNDGPLVACRRDGEAETDPQCFVAAR